MRKTVFFVSFLLLLVVVRAESFYSGGGSYSFSNPQYARPDFQTFYAGDRLQTYWPVLGDKETCESRQDILLQVTPAGCQPAVVRSDLLAEQNVPVFCQIDALQVNPLLDIKSVENIRFTGSYPPEVVGSGFHPARAALRTRDRLLGNPLVNNIGYVVVVLKKQPKEKELPDFVRVNLTGKIEYDAGNALGVGRSEFLLKEVSDSEWEREKLKQSFYQGRYFVRLEDASAESARVSLYSGDRRISSLVIKRGEQSREIYLPGLYCQARVQVAYDGLEAARDRARIEISDEKGTDVIDVIEGSRLLDGQCVVERLNVSGYDMGNVTINCAGERFRLSLGALAPPTGDTGGVALEDTVWKGTDGKPLEIEMKFAELVHEIKMLVADFPNERGRPGVVMSADEPYGESALFHNGVVMAYSLNKPKSAAELLSLLIATYPQSRDIELYKTHLARLRTIDSSNSVYAVSVGNRFRTLRLSALRQPGKQAKALLVWGTHRFDLVLGAERTITGAGTVGDLAKKLTVKLEKVDATSVSLSTLCDGARKSVVLRQDSLRDEERSIVLCGAPLRFESAELEEIAHVRLVPGARSLDTQTNITVTIGIEKRAIQLSPNKTVEKIRLLNESIKKWDSIRENLGRVVSGLKGACFATAGVLTLKNFMTGLSGEALARQEVMRGDYGWTARCKELVGPGKSYATMDACMTANGDAIDKDVAAKQKAIENVNSRINGIEAGYTTKGGGLFGESSIDGEAAKKDLAKAVREQYGNEEIAMPAGRYWSSGSGTQARVKVSDVLAERNLDSMSYAEVRAIYTNLESRRTGLSETGLKGSAAGLGESAARINDNKEIARKIELAKSDQSKGFAAPFYANAAGQRDVYASVVPVNSVSDTNFKFGEGVTHTATVVVPGSSAIDGTPVPSGTYRLGLVDQAGGRGQYVVKEIRDEKGGVVENPEQFGSRYGIGVISPIESISYNNKYENAEVRFYEQEPYKCMPAIVPFDTINGWYAGTKQTLPVLGGIGAYDASGRVSSFWLCNIGRNHREQFEEPGFGDDICQQINLQTGQSLSTFPGLSQDEAKRRIDQAVRAIQDAAQQCGQKNVRVGNENLKSGAPALGVPQTQCQDFMSPKDCHLLFNVCDPVICPATRCNLGGTYQVSDVIQTGIVGSALLCLPNAREGIFMPVCLSGIHAGIDAYVSILKNHRDCLQESVNTGKLVGICDQLYSIYLCEFFWRQVAPVANILLPKLVETAYGQGTRGGGEYLTVMGAWQNTQKSIQYFTQSYAANSVKAFQIRSVEEAGTPFCKAFISAKAPSSFKSLIEPDSPPQFHAYFDSTKFSSATVPATAQYKVFYHIFAGRDSGVYYSVYLKNPPESSYYYSTPYVQVASGFIAKGEYASQTRDFTAPEGYKELCVRINDEEQCGFKQVSTSFASTYLRDTYAQDRLTEQDIHSEKDCVSGGLTVNPGAILANTNPGSLVSEGVMPEDYKRGIIRICATANPGSSTDPLRFVPVGDCGSPKVQCWLDKQSVDKAITESNIGVRNSTLQELEGVTQRYLGGAGDFFTPESAKFELDSLDAAVGAVSLGDAVKVQQVFERIAVVYSKLYLNQDKARAIFLKVSLRHRIVEELYTKADKSNKEKNVAAVTPPVSGSGQPATGGTGSGATPPNGQQGTAGTGSGQTGTSGTGGAGTSGQTSGGSDLSGDRELEPERVIEGYSLSADFATRGSKEVSLLYNGGSTNYYVQSDFIYLRKSFVFDWVKRDEKVGVIKGSLITVYDAHLKTATTHIKDINGATISGLQLVLKDAKKEACRVSVYTVESGVKQAVSVEKPLTLERLSIAGGNIFYIELTDCTDYRTVSVLDSAGKEIMVYLPEDFRAGEIERVSVGLAAEKEVGSIPFAVGAYRVSVNGDTSTVTRFSIATDSSGKSFGLIKRN